MPRVIAPAPGEDFSAALALVNTQYVDLGQLFDELGNARAARDWLADRAGAPPELRLGREGLTRVHDLRAAVREVLSARSEARSPNAGALETLAAVTAAAPGSLRLTSRNGRLSSEWVPGGGDALERALALVAGDAIALTTGERGKQLAACAAPNCIRLLLRDHNRRRWCSTRCGDRVRAAHYRERQRGGSQISS
jgi:predicted RNA-binding Zn ribbon-like protein